MKVNLIHFIMNSCATGALIPKHFQDLRLQMLNRVDDLMKCIIIARNALSDVPLFYFER